MFLRSRQTQPLIGRRILVTRARHQAGKLSEGLRALGAEPVEVPVLEIQPPESYDPLDRALRQFGSYHCAIFTSANTVPAVAGRAASLSISLLKSPPPQVAAVGAATARALHDIGLEVAFVPESYVAESLLDGLSGKLAGKRILLARAAVARDIIPDTLRQQGAIVQVVDAYRNGIPADAADLLRQALATPIDAATFTSSSTVTHLAEAAAKAGIAFPFAGVEAISIGPVTSETLRELNWPPAAEAAPHDIPGLIAAVCRVLAASVN
jgi:uroporphyrinogen-III synthase